VEAILLAHEKRPHEDGKTRREQLFLQVRWLGTEQTSWEPVNGLYHLPIHYARLPNRE
jgi:hypothetical protein